MFGIGNRDIPEKIREAKLSKWYGTLSDTDKVKLNRYMDGADPSSASAFICSVSKLANDDHNYKFVAFLAESTEDIRMDGIQRFYVNEVSIPALYNMEEYDRCDKACDRGLALLKEKGVMERVLKDNGGVLPESLYCRNYKLNVAVGVHYDYDEGDRLLEQFEKDGLISHEEVEYRKQGIKTFRLQKTFDSIFSIKEKDE
ncbi:hypothetical protein [Methanomethylophilus alvi]|uniref:hypothetical protein n=1 Tax=Methanomethylophilus alvi TaxID=1291540 RepID=UPI0037DCF705